MLKLFTFKFHLINILVLSCFLVNIHSLYTVYTQATPTYNREFVLKDYDFYANPEKFNTSAKIESYLCSRSSTLCGRNVIVSLEKKGNSYILNNRDTFNPGEGYLALEGQTFLVSEIIFRLSRTDLIQGCLDNDQNTCFNNSQNPINPGFILATIQKEAGLIYGSCARSNADTNSGCFYSTLASSNPEKWSLQGRMDRATGYFCFETSDRTKSCYDENSNWVIYKGLFRQLYHMMRRVKVLQKMCSLGGNYSFKNSNGDFRVGNTVKINNPSTRNLEDVVLRNDITCALYIYTPHISDLLFRVMIDLGVLSNSLFDRFGVNREFQPNPVFRPKDE